MPPDSWSPYDHGHIKRPPPHWPRYAEQLLLGLVYGYLITEGHLSPDDWNLSVQAASATVERNRDTRRH